MKKRITTPMLLACLFFLMSGFSTLQAQSLEAAAVPSHQLVNGEKQPLVLQDESVALLTVRTEMQINFPAVLPPANNAVDAATYLRYEYLERTFTYLRKGKHNAAEALVTAYNDIVVVGDDVWPGLVDVSWKDDMIDLLSN